MATSSSAPTVPGGDGDSLESERSYLAAARAHLASMREQTVALRAYGGDAASEGRLRLVLDRRFAALSDDAETALFFGRLDHAVPRERFYIGRRHVRDDAGDPVVIDWRAEVATAFYRATRADPMNVALRRRFGVDKGRITAFEDEHLIDATEADVSSHILAMEIERPRVGPMRDIVATIQPEQDVIVRAGFSETVCVQGAPGTGKTAVGLHRAAFLLYAHRNQVAGSGVLVVGPNEGFLAYISQVLPALGEVSVTQVALERLPGHVEIRGEDPPSTALLKGDARMATVLHRALYARLTEPLEPVVVARGTRRWRIEPSRQATIMEVLQNSDVSYGAGRALLSQRLAHEVLVKMEAVGDFAGDRALASLAKSKAITSAVDLLWPRVEPARLVMSLLSDGQALAAVSEGVFTPEEQRSLSWTDPPRAIGKVRWSVADAFLIDEVAHLIERQTSLGHVVLDEAQDLSPMQLRAVGRRCSLSAATVLGDIAQGTTPWATADWATSLRHLGKPDARVEVLDRSYRVPSSVIEFASRLLPDIAAGVPAPSAVPGHIGELDILAVADLDQGVHTATRAALAREGSIAIVAAESMVAEVSHLLRRLGVEHDVLGEGEAATTRLTVVPAALVKGLEYDHVVVVEPAAIVGAEAHHWQGLRRLYVALTRAVSGLTVVHARPLPVGLSQPAA